MNIFHIFKEMIILLIGGSMNHPQSLSRGVYTPLTLEEKIENKVAEYKAPLLLLCTVILLVLIVILVVIVVPPVESGLYYNQFLGGHLV